MIRLTAVAHGSSRPAIESAVAFLRCRTPPGWVELAVTRLDVLLLDHAALELKAAEQAQKLIRRYGASRSTALVADPVRQALVTQLSRLAREELRHFEQVVALINERGERFIGISSSRYAAGLHELARGTGPGALVDALIIGAVIEARSCERFLSLIESSDRLDTGVARFYASLLRSEARHFENYLALARRVGDPDECPPRISVFLDRDRELIEAEDPEFRFHSGCPAADCRARI